MSERITHTLGVKDTGLMLFPVSYPLVDTNGNFLCMANDFWPQASQENSSQAQGKEPYEPEADVPCIVEG